MKLPHATVASIQIGETKTYTDDTGKTWTSAIAKHPAGQSIRVFANNLDGDQQADLKHHGGPDKAVLCYAENHFSAWIDEFEEFATQESMFGAFGENLTIAGLQEEDLCIGDVLQIGTAQFQVSQPRQPCWKLSKRWGIPKLAVNLQKNGRTGWYLRVLETGTVAIGDSIELLTRLHAEWPVSDAHNVMHAKPRDAEADLRLAQCQALSNSWKTQLAERANKKLDHPNSSRDT